ncbi:hypothetical protein J3R30DRAFT_3654615 [Lentinula aciculospora]|uniref:Endonuclease n=1 Tax=Lentinula aciculospora TaxID=153920 RepID=A0A9W9AQN3_9AGAR|nr:hypothetical protein J3R30DRAFT_3654615 [Lentinula aciculospora]
MSSLVQAALFAAGAVVGAGVTAAIYSKKQAQRPSVAPTVDGTIVSPAVATVSPPVIGLGTNGNAQISNLASVASLSSSSVLKYGNPGPIADPIVRRAYVAAYDRRLRHPAWVCKSTLVGPPDETGDRSKSTFMEDETIPVPFRARLADYFRSGYDRGHMVPAADAKFSQEAMNETFYLSNMAPQVGEGFNRHYWAYLEDWCRRLTGAFSDVYVFTVPLYLPRRDPDGKWRITHEVIGSPPNVSVPTHFAKVVLTSKPASPSTPNILELSMGAFVLPNSPIPDDTPLEKFVMPVEAVERAAGLALFSDAVRSSSKHICQSTKCEVIVRRFDDARKRPDMKRTISAPN